jgi:hypothetical protein
LRTQLCGDAHLSNFGAYASPERRLVFDINDFDETLPGSFEWDVKRLAASFVVAGRDNGFSRKQYRKATLAAVETYRTAMRTFAGQPILTVWYEHLEIEQAIADYKATLSARKLNKHKARLKATENALAKAHTRDSLQAIGKLTSVVDGQRRIISNPPLIIRFEDMTELDPDTLFDRLRGLVANYGKTLQSDRRHLLDHFTLTDIAHKVVGSGQCRHPGLDSAVGSRRRGGSPAAPGQTGRTLGPRRLCGPIGVPQQRRACGRRSAPHAGIQ